MAVIASETCWWEHWIKYTLNIQMRLLVSYILWIWLTQDRRNILRKIKTIISAHFLVFSLLHQSFLPHPVTLSVRQWLLPQRAKLRHVPRSRVRCAAPLDSSSSIFSAPLIVSTAFKPSRPHHFHNSTDFHPSYFQCHSLLGPIPIFPLFSWGIVENRIDLFSSFHLSFLIYGFGFSFSWI